MHTILMRILSSHYCSYSVFFYDWIDEIPETLDTEKMARCVSVCLSVCLYVCVCMCVHVCTYSLHVEVFRTLN